MVDVEITRKRRLTREEAGKRLIALGEALVGGKKSEVGFDGDSFRFTVADRVEWEFQLEVEGDEVELEIELTWSDAPAAKAAPAEPAAEPAAESPPAAATPARRRTKSSRGSSGG